MNRIDPSSQALELTPWVWGVLALIALLGFAHWISDRDELETLLYLEKENPVIVRSAGGTHIFPRLGIEVTLAKDWTYLSVTDDAAADQPTFVNESTHSIVSLRRFRFLSWPPVESTVTTQHYRGTTIEWIKVDHRAVGRLTGGDVDLTLMVVTHLRDSELNDSVENFCKGIQLIVATD